MPLSLLYQFPSNPWPLRASSSAGDRVIVSLDVSVANPSLDEIDLATVEIDIPVGDDTAATVLTQDALPAATGVQGGENVAVSVTVGTIMLSPTKGEAFTIPGGGAVKFTLAEIQVNLTQGPVPVTVTETPAGAEPQPIIDSTTYTLSKSRHPTPPIATFIASPAVLTDLYKTVLTGSQANPRA